MGLLVIDMFNMRHWTMANLLKTHNKQNILFASLVSLTHKHFIGIKKMYNTIGIMRRFFIHFTIRYDRLLLPSYMIATVCLLHDYTIVYLLLNLFFVIKKKYRFLTLCHTIQFSRNVENNHFMPYICGDRFLL